MLYLHECSILFPTDIMYHTFFDLLSQLTSCRVDLILTFLLIENPKQFTNKRQHIAVTMGIDYHMFPNSYEIILVNMFSQFTFSYSHTFIAQKIMLSRILDL